MHALGGRLEEDKKSTPHVCKKQATERVFVYNDTPSPLLFPLSSATLDEPVANY